MVLVEILSRPGPDSLCARASSCRFLADPGLFFSLELAGQTLVIRIDLRQQLLHHLDFLLVRVPVQNAQEQPHRLAGDHLAAGRPGWPVRCCGSAIAWATTGPLIIAMTGPS